MFQITIEDKSNQNTNHRAKHRPTQNKQPDTTPKKVIHKTLEASQAPGISYSTFCKLPRKSTHSLGRA